MKIILRNKLAVLCTTFCAVLLAFGHNASATAFTIGDSHELGFVNYGIPSGDADRTTYVNHLIGMGLGTADSADGQDYTRSSNIFSPLDPAVQLTLVNGTGTSVDLGGGYLYLFAKYDGPITVLKFGTSAVLPGPSRFLVLPAHRGTAFPGGRSLLPAAAKVFRTAAPR